jgi:hypothetical protein
MEKIARYSVNDVGDLKYMMPKGIEEKKNIERSMGLDNVIRRAKEDRIKIRT